MAKSVIILIFSASITLFNNKLFGFLIEGDYVALGVFFFINQRFNIDLNRKSISF